MAALTLTDVDMLCSGLDLSCFANTIQCSQEVAEVESTTFCSGGWRTVVPGIRSSMLMASGPTDMATATAAQTSSVDEFLGVDIGTEYVVSVMPVGATVGEPGWFTQAKMMQRNLLDGSIGDIASHSVTLGGTTPIVRGQVATASTITATGNGTAANLGAVSATQRIWAAVHTLTVGGTATPTITVKIQSSTASGFASPTDRITFSAITSKTGLFSSTVGAITDTWWRATWTVSGTNPSFQTRILFGIY